MTIEVNSTDYKYKIDGNYIRFKSKTTDFDAMIPLVESNIYCVNSTYSVSYGNDLYYTTDPIIIATLIAYVQSKAPIT